MVEILIGPLAKVGEMTKDIGRIPVDGEVVYGRVLPCGKHHRDYICRGPDDPNLQPILRLDDLNHAPGMCDG